MRFHLMFVYLSLKEVSFQQLLLLISIFLTVVVNNSIHQFLINKLQSQMFRKCIGCFSKLGWKLFGQNMPRWQQHLDNYCLANCQKYLWCEMLLDNFDLIKSFGSLSKELQHQIRNTNISSEIVKIISNHYKTDEHLFKFCIELFGSYLKLKYSDVVNPSKSTFNKLTKDYQEFLSLLIDLVVIYYKLEDRQILGEDLFYKQTLPCLIVSFFFENQDISKSIHHIIRHVNKQTIEKIQFNSQKYANYSIDDFEISQNLRLNKKTLDLFQVRGSNASQKQYLGAIQIVKQIVRVSNPSEKLHLIEGLQKQIQSTILNFYKKYGIKVEGVEIDYKNMISILLYIVVQANQSNLYSQVQLIAHFQPKKNNKNNDCSLEHFNYVLQMLEKGNISKQYRQQSDFGFRNIEGKSYFDEVSAFQL